MKIQNPILSAGLVSLIGVSRYVLTLVAALALWWYGAPIVNKAFRVNLDLITWTSNALDSSGRTEAALHALAADKMLLFAEISVIVWLLGKALWWLITLPFRRRAASKAATPAEPHPAEDLAARLETRSGPSLTISERPTGIRAER